MDTSVDRLAGVRAPQPPKKDLAVAVGDAAFGQIVGRELQRDAVAVHNLDAVSPQPAGHGGEDDFSQVELDGEHSGFELLDYFAVYFYAVFF